MTRHVMLVSQTEARSAPEELEDLFPGHWNPRRPFQYEVRPLVCAVMDALREAKWWTSALADHVDGGLIVGTDLHVYAPALRFHEALEREPVGVLRPSEFLNSLPSTPAATLSLLFGLASYQATLSMQGASGFQALLHGADQIRLGRLERVVVAALSAISFPVGEQLRAVGLSEESNSFSLASAWCLTAHEGEPPPGATTFTGGDLDEEAEGATSSETLLTELPSGYRVLAAPSLLAVARSLSGGAGPRVLTHRDPCSGQSATLRLQVH